MKPNNFINNLQKTGNKLLFKAKKRSPELLLAGGIITGAACVVTACKATLKVQDIVEEPKKTLEIINEKKAELESGKELKLSDGSEYTIKDAKRDKWIVYRDMTFGLAKAYAPAVGFGVLSLTCFCGSYGIMKKRHAALSAAYMAIDKTFKDYRGRVVERFGEKVDKELRYDIRSQEVEETVTDKKGKEKVEKKSVDIANLDAVHSDYAKIYDDGCLGWTKSPEANLVFLKQVQCWANDRLQKHGHLFLNEVYEALGFPHTAAGSVVGWYYDKDNPVGDNYVDFGIYNVNCSANRNFVNGYENVIVLDFNVDGEIYKLL